MTRGFHAFDRGAGEAGRSYQCRAVSSNGDQLALDRVYVLNCDRTTSVLDFDNAQKSTPCLFGFDCNVDLPWNPGPKLGNLGVVRDARTYSGLQLYGVNDDFEELPSF